MSEKKFKIRAKPRKPARKINQKAFICNVYESDNPVDDPSELIYISEEDRKKYHSFALETEFGFYPGDSDKLVLYGFLDESDEDYAKRLVKYEKRLAEYEKWLEDNKENIEKESARREKEEAAAKARKLAKLKREIKKLENDA